ncbi:hypothetical protein DB30_05472 [Enhygromyxa salina]|uniref:Uncharacterized protein n=1 Tax=Enhygromyxa salina TaxID=215803 RepID=A0A0C1ZX09_9BACT|nr:hypothetical protein [Enhygromyxa salina]KIG15598.1 hypothetical protein DB30_05472 [Enhygromyxa salina]
MLERVDDVLRRVRKLLPDLTNDAKIGRRLDDFDELDADMIAALADHKAITRKLDEVEFEQTKLELALEQDDPDLDRVERLAGDVERSADELENLVNGQQAAKHADADVSSSKVSKETLEALEEGRDVENVSELAPEVFDAELRYVANADGREISLEIGSKHYDREVVLPNGHTYRRDKKTNSWCRFSKPKKGNCGTSDSEVQASQAHASDAAGGECRTASHLPTTSLILVQSSTGA